VSGIGQVAGPPRSRRHAERARFASFLENRRLVRAMLGELPYAMSRRAHITLRAVAIAVIVALQLAPRTRPSSPVIAPGAEAVSLAP